MSNIIQNIIIIILQSNSFKNFNLSGNGIIETAT